MAWASQVIVSARPIIDEFGRDTGRVSLSCEVLTSSVDDADEAGNAARMIVKALAGGKRAFFRSPIEVDVDLDFDTKITTHKGYCRFIVLDEAGAWEAMVAPSGGSISEFKYAKVAS